MKTTIVTTIAIVILMIGAQSAYAEQFGHQYYWGWRDGYQNWVFSAEKPDAYGWPNDDEGHLPNYWKGVDAGIKYAQEHVMVKVVQGHVLTEYGARNISDWFDGQTAHTNGQPLSKMYATDAYIAGYNATYGTLPPEIPLSQQVLAQKLTYP